MRSFVLLSLIALVAAQPTVEEQGDCMVDGAGAVSDLIDSTMFIWASIQRCGKAKSDVKCEVAITSAIESVNKMINVIVRAVDKCGHVQSVHKECGMAVGRLTASVAGLAAATGGIVQKCPNAFAHQAHDSDWSKAKTVTCVVDLKHLATSLFKAIKALMRVSKQSNCVGDACVSNDLKVVAALAGLGEFLSGAIGSCTVSKNTDDLVCTEEIARLVKGVTAVSGNGLDVHNACAAAAAPQAIIGGPAVLPPARLFAQIDHTEADQTPTISANLLLGAFLPVTAIVSFVGGRFYANRNSAAREVMSDVE